MSSTEIRWSMTGADDPFAPIATNQITILRGFWGQIEGNGPDVARDVVEQFFDDDTWAKYLGAEEVSGAVLLTITAPVACAGVYEVAMERVVRATAVLREGVEG